MKFDTSLKNGRKGGYDFMAEAKKKVAAQEEKKFDLNAPVKPVIAWSAYAGTLAVAVVLALIFWL
jgi:hypothetical protein